MSHFVHLTYLKFKITISSLEIEDETVWIQQKHYLELISWFLLQLVMQDFLRQRLIIMSAKLVVEIRWCYCLLFIEIFITSTWLKMIKWFIWCSFSKSTNRIKCWSCLSYLQFWFDLTFVNLIELKFLIVFLILNCIAFVRLLDRRRNFEVVIWARSRIVIAWLEYRKFILNRSFRQVVLAFLIVLMFLICHYYFE